MSMYNVEPRSIPPANSNNRSQPGFSSFGQELRKEDLEEGKVRSNSKGSQESMENSKEQNEHNFKFEYE